MRILYVVPYLRLPPVNTSTEYHTDMIQALAERGHDVDVVSYVDKSSDLTRLREICCHIEAIPKDLSRLGTPLSMFSAVLKGIPFTVRKYYSERFVAILDRMCSRVYDIALLEHIQMSQFGGLLLKHGIPVALRFHDVEAVRLQLLARSNAPIYTRLFAWIESYRMYRYECKMAGCFPVITMTEDDRCLLIRGQKTFQNSHNIHVVPLAVNCERYYPMPECLQEMSGKEIVFIGPADYYKNAISLLWFVENVFPLIKNEIPEAQLRVVNIRQGSPLSRRLSRVEGVSLVEYKDDIRPEMARASVLIAPMQIASGMSGRVLTSLAMAKPLVATTIACRGIDIVHGKHAWIADSPTEFARGVCILLRNSSLAHEMGKQGRRLVEDKYSLNRVSELLEETLVQILRGY
jgi:glycosyltransferase involved in cell wall biosynthesis